MSVFTCVCCDLWPFYPFAASRKKPTPLRLWPQAVAPLRKPNERNRLETVRNRPPATARPGQTGRNPVESGQTRHPPRRALTH